jgi:hypothetical protein
MKKVRKYKKILLAGSLILPLAWGSCVDKYLPESLDGFDKEAGFTQTLFRPQLGRTQLITNTFNGGNSTLPLSFEITGISRWDGTPAPELTEFYPVKVWDQPYLGTEQTLAEVEAKRRIEYRRLFDIRKHSGELILWENANSNFVLCEPDSCYYFDVLVQNSGGFKYTTRMRLLPQREVEFEPANIDPNSGLSAYEYVNPTAVRQIRFKDRIQAGGKYLLEPEDVKVYFRKVEENTAPEKTLTFRFFNADYTPIDPARFNTTDWENLLHGFDMEKTAEFVRYKTPYPIPLTTAVTPYSNTRGDRISAIFSFDRINTYGVRTPASMTLEFAIYTEAHWEIHFVFASGEPLFDDYV